MTKPIIITIYKEGLTEKVKRQLEYAREQYIETGREYFVVYEDKSDEGEVWLKTFSNQY